MPKPNLVSYQFPLEWGIFMNKLVLTHTTIRSLRDWNNKRHVTSLLRLHTMRFLCKPYVFFLREMGFGNLGRISSVQERIQKFFKGGGGNFPLFIDKKAKEKSVPRPGSAFVVV